MNSKPRNVPQSYRIFKRASNNTIKHWRVNVAAIYKTNKSSSTNGNDAHHTRRLRGWNEEGGRETACLDVLKRNLQKILKILKNLRDLYFVVKHAKLEHSFRTVSKGKIIMTFFFSPSRVLHIISRVLNLRRATVVHVFLRTVTDRSHS